MVRLNNKMKREVFQLVTSRTVYSQSYQTYSHRRRNRSLLSLRNQSFNVSVVRIHSILIYAKSPITGIQDIIKTHWMITKSLRAFTSHCLMKVLRKKQRIRYREIYVEHSLIMNILRRVLRV